MSCRDMDHLIQLYVDQEIDGADLKRLREHVNGCASCRKSLDEMIALVQTLEEIRGQQELIRPFSMVNHGVKWMAVATSVAFIIIFSPSLQHHYIPQEPTVAGTTPQPDTIREVEELPVASEVMVLATGSESLPIPNSDNIRVVRPVDDDEDEELDGENIHVDTAWVYPSAIPFVLQGGNEWHKELKRLIFVGVPDYDTLHTLLTITGLTLEETVMEEPVFPTSVILTTGKDPQIKTFTFPENQKKFSSWFNELSTSPVMP